MIRIARPLLAVAAALMPVASLSAQTSPIAVPPAISAAGQIVFCTEAGFPPMEFFPTDSTDPAGFDIEMGHAIAKQMGVKAVFENMGFDGLIAALLSKKCDAILSAMNATDTRKKQVDFADYIGDGYALIVRKGNPKAIKVYDAICGLTVGVQVATTNLEEVTRQSAKCQADGKPPVDIKVFQNDTGLRLALASNQIDAYNQSGATAAYAIVQDPNTFQMAAPGPIAADEGLAIRKEDRDLQAALNAAIKTLYKDGSMKTMLSKWNLDGYALPM